MSAVATMIFAFVSIKRIFLSTSMPNIPFMIRSKRTTSGFSKKYFSRASMPSPASVTSCPAFSKMLRRIRRDIAESSTMSILAIRYLYYRIVHSLQRHHAVGQLCFDDCARHAVDDATLLCLSEDESAL